MRLMSIQKSTLSRGQFNFIMRKLEEILDEILSKRINHVRLILNICSLLKNLKNIQSKKAKIKDMFEFAEKCQLYQQQRTLCMIIRQHFIHRFQKVCSFNRSWKQRLKELSLFHQKSRNPIRFILFKPYCYGRSTFFIMHQQNASPKQKIKQKYS